MVPFEFLYYFNKPFLTVFSCLDEQIGPLYICLLQIYRQWNVDVYSGLLG